VHGERGKRVGSEREREGEGEGKRGREGEGGRESIIYEDTGGDPVKHPVVSPRLDTPSPLAPLARYSCPRPLPEHSVCLRRGGRAGISNLYACLESATTQ
jgi:hypothetical protein